MKVAVVTGAASGMGRACARRFVAEGWTVAALDRDQGPLAVLAEELGDVLLPVSVDVRDAAALAAAVARTGPVSACVNAAGVFPVSTLSTASEGLYRTIFDTNVLGTVLVSQAVAPGMVAAGGGAIVNFASVDAFAPSSGQLLYCASKSAVVALTRSMALELAPAGVRVNAVAPGWIDTEGNRATGRMAGAEAKVPLGRIGTPEEIADLVWLLAGEDRAGYVTGETIVASGGSLVR